MDDLLTEGERREAEESAYLFAASSGLITLCIFYTVFVGPTAISLAALIAAVSFVVARDANVATIAESKL